MMLPTHVLCGMVLAVPLTVVAPELAPAGLVAGSLGGLFPDLDLYVGHRKTLHYPVYYPAAAIVGLLAAAAAPSTATVAAAFFLLGAAVHSASDVFGSGLELRPWEATSERAVYDHFHGRWIEPRRLVRYDGSAEDLLLSTALAGVLLVSVDGPLALVVTGTLAVGAVYAALRRPLATAATVVVGLLPSELASYVPPRYVEEGA